MGMRDSLEMKKHRMKPILFHARYWVMGCAFFLLGLGVLANFTHRQRVVTYDVNHTLNLFTKEIARHHLTPTQLKVVSKRLSHALEITLKNYAVAHHAVILKASLVVASNDDITPEIEKQLSSIMKEGNR